MDYQAVIDFINEWIVANGNNEITADVLRPILIAMVDQANDVTGDLGDLNTANSDNLVAAINEVNAALSTVNNNGIKLHTGTGNPNDPGVVPSYNYADFYMQLDLLNVPILLYQYNGLAWVTGSEVNQPNEIISIGAITRVGNTFTIPAGATWRINGTVYTNASAYSTTIAEAAAGYARVDLLVARADSTFSKVVGVEAIGVADTPLKPNNTVAVIAINIIGAVIQDAPPPAIGDDYISKASKASNIVSGTVVNNMTWNDKTKYTILAADEIKGISATYLGTLGYYENQKYSLYNISGSDVIIRHNDAAAEMKFLFPSGVDFTLPDNTTIEFDFVNGNAFSLVGSASSGGGAVSSVNALTGAVVVNGANIDVTNPVTSTQTDLDTALADIEAAAGGTQDIDNVLGVGNTATGKSVVLVGNIDEPTPSYKAQTADESEFALVSPAGVTVNNVDGFETSIAKDKVRLSKDGFGVDIKSDLQAADAVWTIPEESAAEIFASQGWTAEQIAAIEAGNCAIEAGDNVTVTGTGAVLDPYIIGSTTWDGVNVNVLDPTDSVERALNAALDNILTIAEAIPEINVLFLQNSAYGVKLYTNTSGFQTTLPLVDEGGSNAAGLMPYSDHTAIAANTAAIALREQYFYRNPVASSAITGVTTQTYLSFAKIDANALQNGSEFSIDFLVNKTGTAGTFVLKIWKNTSNSLSGATQIAEVTGLAATGWGMFHREIIVDGSNIVHFTTATGAINDSSTILANVATSSAFDVTVDNYFIISVTPTSSADSFICRKATIKGIR